MKISTPENQVINCERRIKEIRVMLKRATKMEDIERMMKEISDLNSSITKLKESINQ